MHVSVHHCVVFFPGEGVYDSDDDWTDGGDTASDENDPNIGAVSFSFIHSRLSNSYLAQISK